MLCVSASGAILALAMTTFTLRWVHSVERTDWTESWRIVGDRLQVVEARVEGPGAGIGIPDGAKMTPQGWIFVPALPPLPRLVLAASGATPSGWTLCAAGECRELGTTPEEPIEIWAAPICRKE